jgi:putative intracellular protease/amidase
MNVLLICTEEFNPQEFWTALGILRKRGHEVTVASTNYVIRSEETKRKYRIGLTVGDLLDKDLTVYDALMFTSGNMNMTKKNWMDDRLHLIVDAFSDRTKPIAATCGSVPIIRYAAKGKKVSFFPLIAARQLLVGEGAIPSGVAITRDQNLVTAEFPFASEMWTEEFCNLLEGKDTQYEFHPSGFTPTGKPRRPIPEVARLQEAIDRGRLREQGQQEQQAGNQEAGGEASDVGASQGNSEEG